MWWHGDVREAKRRENWRMEWVASTLHTASEHGVSNITTADAHTSAASSRLNWRPRRFKWTCPFRRKTKSGFCACAVTFQTQSVRGLSLYCQNYTNTAVCLYWYAEEPESLIFRFRGSILLQAILTMFLRYVRWIDKNFDIRFYGFIRVPVMCYYDAVG